MSDNCYRHFLILKSLPRLPQKIDIQRILQQLAAVDRSVTERSLQRDLNKLSGTYPIVSDGAKPAGWSWTREAVMMNLPALDPHEALAMQLAQSYLERLLPSATLDHLEPQFRLAAETLDKHGNGLRKWPDKIRVLPRGPALATPKVNPEAQTTLYDALLKEKRVRIHYRKSATEESNEYELNPLGLIVRDRVSYLIATAGDYLDPRQYALHRVESAEILDTPAVCPKGFDIDAFIRQGEMAFATGRNIHLRFALAPSAARQLRECPLAPDQTIIEAETEDGYPIIEATVQDSMELRWWLQSFGDEAKILEPSDLREAFRDVANNLAGYYDDEEEQ